MKLLVNILIFAATAVFMEFVAWALHKYVMHGFLWVLHEDHHQTTGRRLQKNDFFAVFFATVAILLIYNGVFRQWWTMAAVGFGVTLYGIGYVVFHDIMVHRRVRAIHYKPRARYMKRIIAAHHVHHKNRYKEGGISFSFLYAPKKYDVQEP
jgi:beta-carotene 3-hydroxylase